MKYDYYVTFAYYGEQGDNKAGWVVCNRTKKIQEFSDIKEIIELIKEKAQLDGEPMITNYILLCERED